MHAQPKGGGGGRPGVEAGNSLHAGFENHCRTEGVRSYVNGGLFDGFIAFAADILHQLNQDRTRRTVAGSIGLR